MKSKIYKSNEAREKLAQGVDEIVDVIKVTMGAAGRNTVIDYDGYPLPRTTRDGFLSGNSIFLEDKALQAGVRLVKNACETSVSETGDASSSTAVLIQAIVKKGLGMIDNSVNVNLVARGMEKAKDNIIKHLNKTSKKVSFNSKNLLNVATISANNDKKIGGLVSDAINMSGEYGRVQIENSNSIYTTIESKDGFIVDASLLASEFINKNGVSNELINPLVLVTNILLENIQDISNILTITQQANRPILIIGTTIQGDLLATLVVNFVNKRLITNAVEVAQYGENSLDMLSDIANSVGAVFISQESGLSLQEVTIEMLGECEKSITDRFETRLIGGKSNKEAIEGSINNINSQLEDKEIDPSRKEFLKDRLASLSSGIVNIYIGSQTKVEAEELKERVEDCIGSCLVSIKKGALRGGGTALYDASTLDNIIYKGITLDDEKIGGEIIQFAIREPAITIIVNSGLERDEAVNILDTLKNNEIYNVLNYNVENSFKAGVIDATLVITTALQNAVSTSIAILKTESLIVNKNN